MDKKEIRALLEKLMGAFADTEEEKLEAGDAAEEVTDEVEEEIAEDETPEVEAAEEAAEEVSEDLTDDAEDSDDNAEEMAELEEEDAEEERHEALTDEMKALIRSEVAKLFKEMSKGSGREVKKAEDEVSSRLNKMTGIYGPNND